MAKILFVLTGARHWTLADGAEHPTGFWAEELVAPYRAFTEAGHEVVLATPGGVVPTVDQVSLTPDLNGGPEGARAMAAALAGVTALRNPADLSSVDPEEYDAVFYAGGHGPMEDLATDRDSARVLGTVLTSGRPVGLVCHGLAAVLATESPDGGSPFAGYRLTGFTKAEEALTGLAPRAKWLLEDRLVALGAKFVPGEPYAPHVVVDRNLHTGQNPASSAPLAAEFLKALS
ncbi:type 1 glutamine amidotransferase domain-containing protein [Herbidospora sp. NEAU-GS84]|uniref:Type 1 glutamine amidotransferase domain-containing protein n=1 Tax=Herbidospora solisilvae TaxID=2696284 RepID=A0A7C9MU56_9ACTN|nr:type 1 glutamine amidotransferase domain-containing protein [Herbidospora solisilvae]NAS20251.1 type 1 glutamine amidotransferase domain-containing protein [Herbidospora solisilvae]